MVTIYRGKTLASATAVWDLNTPGLGLSRVYSDLDFVQVVGRGRHYTGLAVASLIEPELDGQWPLFLHTQAAADIARKGHRTAKRVRGTSIRLETNKYAKNFHIGSISDDTEPVL